jgi:hypothetical protein
MRPVGFVLTSTNKPRPQPMRSEGVQASIARQWNVSCWIPRRLWLAVGRLGHAQVPLNRLTLAIVALLFVLGAVAVGHGDGFLYGHF